MRINLPLLILACLLGLSARAIDVYVVAGQSNGWRISSLRPGNAAGAGKIHYFGMKCVSEPTKGSYQHLAGVSGMGTGLVTALSKLSDDDIVFIQYCRCGGSTWNKAANGWYPGDNPAAGELHSDGLYGSFQQYLAHARNHVENVLKLKWEPKALIWHQGESDSIGARADTYETRLKNLFVRFRQDLGPDLPIVVGQVRQLNEHTRKVNDAIARLAAADPLAATIEVQDLSFEKPHKGNPNVHFNGAGCHEMGKRLADALKPLLKATATPPTPQP